MKSLVEPNVFLSILFDKLAPFRNQLLTYGIMGSLIIFYFTPQTQQNDDPDLLRQAAFMRLSAVILLFFVLILYMVLLYFPSSEAEREFRNDSRIFLEDHRKRKITKNGVRKFNPKESNEQKIC